MFHLKSFLYGEVQDDTWPDYSVSDRAAIRQQMQLHGHGNQLDTSEPNKETTITKPQTNSSNNIVSKEAVKPLVPANKVDIYLITGSMLRLILGVIGLNHFE